MRFLSQAVVPTSMIISSYTSTDISTDISTDASTHIHIRSDVRERRNGEVSESSDEGGCGGSSRRQRQ